MTLPNDYVEAFYSESKIPHYKGNPLIEALPRLLRPKNIREALSDTVDFNKIDTNCDNQDRIHQICELLSNFFQPLQRHVILESKLSTILRDGYVGRNPATGEHNTHIQNAYERLMKGDLDAYRFKHAKSTANSLAFIGCSGSGKTRSINQILSNYPQAIHHKKYNIIQIVYLKIDCPHDGSLKNLCHNFFTGIDKILGTDFLKKYTQKRHNTDYLITAMAQIANRYPIGLLVIDEIQHLSLKRSGGAERMLNFFVTLVNNVSIPVIMVGTPKARPIFELDLRSARRGVGLGSIIWEPLENPQANQTAGGKSEWSAFTNKLWKYQWLKKAPKEVPNEIRELWYELSQGIMDIVIKLFVLSQIRAVITGTERITPQLMRRVYREELKPIHPMIDALKSGDPTKISQFSDLIIPDVDKKILELERAFQSSSKKPAKKVNFADNSDANSIHNALVELGFESVLLEPLIKRAFSENPKMSKTDLIQIIAQWYSNPEKTSKKQTTPPKKLTREKDWHTLDSDDLRFIHSQASEEDSFLEMAERNGSVFDINRWMNSSN